MRILLEYQIYCRGCNTIVYIDKRLPTGHYNFIEQKYGRTEFLRFVFNSCAFCTFDEDIEAMKEQETKKEK